MKRRRQRQIGPKRIPNKAALVKMLIIAGVVLAGGLTITFLTLRFTEAAAPAEGEEESLAAASLGTIPALVLLVTVVATLALVFFGYRAYRLGMPTRTSLQSGRMKINRSQS